MSSLHKQLQKIRRQNQRWDRDLYAAGPDVLVWLFLFVLPLNIF